VQKAEADPEWIARTREKLQDKDFVKNKLLANAQFKAIQERLKLQKAQANAAKAEASAKGSTSDASTLL